MNDAWRRRLMSLQQGRSRRRAPQPASDSDAVKKPTHYVIDPARVEQLRPLARILLIQARRQLAREARDAAPGMGRAA